MTRLAIITDVPPPAARRRVSGGHDADGPANGPCAIGTGIDDARNIARLLPWIVGTKALHPVDPTAVTVHDLPPCRLRS